MVSLIVNKKEKKEKLRRRRLKQFNFIKYDQSVFEIWKRSETSADRTVAVVGVQLKSATNVIAYIFGRVRSEVMCVCITELNCVVCNIIKSAM